MTRTSRTDALTARVAELAAELVGGARVAVCVRELATGAEARLDAERPYALASVIKIPIAIELYRQAELGQLDLAEHVPIRDVLVDDEDGVLARFRPGDAVLSLRALAVLMLGVSDNTATNLLLDRLGLPAVNTRLDALGVGAIRVRRKMLDAAARARGEENVGTAGALVDLLAALATGRCLGPTATAEMLALLRANQVSFVRRGLAADPVIVADKNGELDGIRTSAMVLEPRDRAHGTVVVSILTSGLADEAAGEAFAVAVARAALQAFA